MSTDSLSIIIVDRAHRFGRGLRNALSQRNSIASFPWIAAKIASGRVLALGALCGLFAVACHRRLGTPSEKNCMLLDNEFDQVWRSSHAVT